MTQAPETPPPEERPTATKKRLPTGFATLRDILTFVIGLGILGHEVFWSDKVETAVLAVGLTMIGLPVVFGADERRKGGDPEK